MSLEQVGTDYLAQREAASSLIAAMAKLITTSPGGCAVSHHATGAPRYEFAGVTHAIRATFCYIEGRLLTRVTIEPERLCTTPGSGVPFALRGEVWVSADGSVHAMRLENGAHGAEFVLKPTGETLPRDASTVADKVLFVRDKD